MRICNVCGRTQAETRIIKKEGIDYCRKHYLQLYRHGKILSHTIYEPNSYEVKENIAYISLYNVKGEFVGRILIDKEDLEKVLKYKWHIKRSRNTSYAITHHLNSKIFLHRLILDYKGKEDIDHINGNGLDNRKCNLRIVSHSVNMRNQKHKKSLGVKKVPSGKYQAAITKDGRSIYLGTFSTFEEAQKIRNEKEKELQQV